MNDEDASFRIAALEAQLAEVRRRLTWLERQAGATAVIEEAAPQAAPPSPTPPKEPVAQPVPVPQAPWQPPRPREWSFDFEELLGRHLLAWIGGVTVLLGVVLFLVAAASRGWIGAAARVSLAFAGSTLLLLLGVWLHERVGRTQAARIAVAASIASLYASLAAATVRYEVISKPAGLAVAGLVAIVAGSLAVRWHAKEIAGLGVVGALLAPVLVDTGTSTLALGFVALALVGALVAVIWQRWSWLSTLAYLVSLPQLLAWAWEEHHGNIWLALGVLVAFWLLYLVVAIGYELRVRSSRLRPEAAMLAIADAVVTSAYGYALLRSEVSVTAGTTWVLAMAALHVVIGMAVARRQEGSREVALVLAALGVGLSAIGLALALDGPALVAGWAAEAVLLAWLAQRTGGRRALLGSLALLGAAAVRALGYETDRIGDHLTGSGVSGAALAALLIAAVAAAAVGFLLERRPWALATPRSLSNPDAPDAREPLRPARALGETLRFAAVALAAIALDVAASGGWLVLAWTLASIALVPATRRLGSLALALGEILLLSLATLHVLSFEAPLGHALSSGLPHLGWGFGASLALVGGWLAVTLLTGFERLFGHEVGESVLAACATVGGALGFYVASVLILTLAPENAAGATPAGHALVSAFWGASGFVGVLLGLVREKRLLRHSGLVLLGLALGKVFVYDLRSIGDIARVFSFVGLGLLLLAAAFVYQHLARSLGRRAGP